MSCFKILLFATLFVLSFACQNESAQDKTAFSLEEIAHKIVAKSGTCTLITVDNNGQPRARIMDPFPANEDFIIWFGTNTKSRKVNEIKTNNKATVIYYDKAGASYVSLYGEAEIITDEKAIAKYWKTTWQNFYPDYPEGYGLIRFKPNYFELISEEYGITGDPITWKPATITF